MALYKTNADMLEKLAMGVFHMSVEIIYNGCLLHTLFIHRASVEKYLSSVRWGLVKKNKIKKDEQKIP